MVDRGAAILLEMTLTQSSQRVDKRGLQGQQEVAMVSQNTSRYSTGKMLDRMSGVQSLPTASGQQRRRIDTWGTHA